MQARYLTPKTLINYHPFDRLSVHELIMLASNTLIEEAEPGKQLVAINDTTPHSLFLVKGKVKLRAADEREKIIDTDDGLQKTPISHLLPHKYEVTSLSEVSYFFIDNGIINGILARLNRAGEEIEEHLIEKSCFEHPLFNEIFQDIMDDNLNLPQTGGLIKGLGSILYNDKSLDSVASLLMANPSIAANVMRLGNGPLYTASRQADSLRGALRNIGSPHEIGAVVNLASKTLCTIHDRAVAGKIDKVWQQSLEMAIISRNLAARTADLDGEVAMNYALFLNIGMVIIYQYAYQRLATIDDAQLNEELLHLHRPVSKLLLHYWNFPRAYVALADWVDDWSDSSVAAADYHDVLALARVFSYIGKDVLRDMPPTDVGSLPQDLAVMPAFSKLGFSRQRPKEVMDFVQGCRRVLVRYTHNTRQLAA